MSDQECPDCEGESIEGRGCRTCNSTGKICGAGLPPVDPEVLDRAVEEGRESVRTGMHVNTTQGYQEQEFRAIAAAAYRQGREDGLREAREAADRVLLEHGLPETQIPQGRDEWGPVCAGCGDKEFRIDGFCSIECRDGSQLSFEMRDAIRSLLTDKEGEQ